MLPNGGPKSFAHPTTDCALSSYHLLAPRQANKTRQPVARSP